MLPKKSPVKLSPFIAGMLDGASHPINPNPITFKSLRSQSLWKHVYFPPEACATFKGFLAVVGDFKNAEFKVGCSRLRLRLTEEREEVAKPTTVEVAAAIIRRLNWLVYLGILIYVVMGRINSIGSGLRGFWMFNGTLPRGYYVDKQDLQLDSHIATSSSKG